MSISKTIEERVIKFDKEFEPFIAYRTNHEKVYTEEAGKVQVVEQLEHLKSKEIKSFQTQTIILVLEAVKEKCEEMKVKSEVSDNFIQKSWAIANNSAFSDLSSYLSEEIAKIKDK